MSGRTPPIRDLLLLGGLALVFVVAASLPGDGLTVQIVRGTSALAFVAVAILMLRRRGESGHRGGLSPHRLLDEIEEDADRHASSVGARLQIECTSPLPMRVDTDGALLRDALRDAVYSAIDLSALGGTILLIAHCRLEGRRQFLEFTIIDAGSGLPPEELRKLFTKWESDEESDRLTRAGVNVRRLGGRLLVKRWPGFGSVTRIEIPAGVADPAPAPDREPSPATTEAAPAEPAPAASSESSDSVPAPTAVLEGLRILVVDDIRVNRTLLEKLVLKRGATTVLAEDGEQALECHRRADDAGEPFDCVLMDIHMPGMDGFETTRQLREEGARTPIIAVTADAALGGPAEFEAKGFDAYLPKPVSPKKLVSAIRDLCSRPRPAVNPGAARDGARSPK